MIRLVGNCAELIPNGWKERVVSTTGEIRPNNNMGTNDYVEEQRKLWEEAGYSADESVRWEMFYAEDFDTNINLHEHELFKEKQVKWWIVKVNPGKCFPFHSDSFNFPSQKIERYWIALDDHEWGHVFIAEDKILSGYKKGDVFQFDNETHGAMNIGLTPKISLQVVAVS